MDRTHPYPKVDRVNDRKLLVMRHGKSSWKQQGLSDYQRPLNKRGQQAVPMMAQILQEKNCVPDLVLSSSATRAKQTTGLLSNSWNDEVELIYEDLLYLAAPDRYLQTISNFCSDEKCVMVVGHNPGLEYLVEELTGELQPIPTAAVAAIDVMDQGWSRLSSGRLIEFLRPKEI